MKRNLVLLGLLIIIPCLISTASEDRFTQALKTCSAYSGGGKVQTSGIDVISKKSIIGWSGDKCVYRETINMMGTETNVTCRLTKSQINELVSVLEAYELLQKYSGNTPDFSDLESAQDNPATKAWTKYLTDPSICTIVTQ